MKNETQTGFRNKIKYRFDSIMSKGMASKILLLFAVLLAIIFLLGLISSLVLGAPHRLLWAVWETLLSTLDTGNLGALDDHAHPAFMFVMLLATMFGLFFMALLISLVSGGMTQKMNELAKGRSRVLENGHIVILGYNDTTLLILEELLEANRNQPRKQAVVVLDDKDTEMMGDEIRSRLRKIPGYDNTKIICRNGFVCDFDDLEMCSVRTGRAVIINTSKDFETIKAILACTKLLNDPADKAEPYIVSTIFETKNEATAGIAGQDDHGNNRLEMLSLQKTMARIIVHTSRQPGLSMVFTELLSFQGAEFYILTEDPALERMYGKTLREINLLLKDTIAIGTYGVEEGIRLGTPSENTLQPGGGLVLLQEDDDRLLTEEHRPDIRDIHLTQTLTSRSTVCMIIGVYRLIDDVLREEIDYLPEQSAIVVVSGETGDRSVIRPETVRLVEEKNIRFVREEDMTEMTRETVFSLLEKHRPDNVIVLTNQDVEDFEKEDEKTLRTLLFLREYRKRGGRHFSITSEIHLARNQRLVAATGADDFIISRHIASLLMTQISQNREIASLYRELLTSEGCEIYMKEAKYYIPPDTELSFYNVIDAVAARNEVFIGYRKKTADGYEEPVLNPKKTDETGKPRTCRFSEDDYFVVVAEEMEITD